MGLFKANGTRVTKANISVTAEADPLVKINDDLYETFPTFGRRDVNPTKYLKRLYSRAGDRTMRRSAVDAMFPAATVDSLTPATATAAQVSSGTTVTFYGLNFDGVTAVSFGGTNGTSLSVLSNTKLTVRVPAHATGTVNVVLTGDAGTTTVTNGFVYAA